ncbi:MAG: hypothetical protein HC916_02995 [Coleofasciculaceae cyanobacterium SM2_1_6]|nr:hypothetical protein [Coleofasciculaceae cyanobacterium SM2_1_6]
MLSVVEVAKTLTQIVDRLIYIGNVSLDLPTTSLTVSLSNCSGQWLFFRLRAGAFAEPELTLILVFCRLLDNFLTPQVPELNFVESLLNFLHRPD